MGEPSPSGSRTVRFGTSARRCGSCTQECYAQALEILGREMTVSEVVDEVVKDRPFYETSGGGMTLSGGEPMEQFPFTAALLQAAKRENLHTCLQTAGHVPFEQYREILPHVDVLLYDLKETDPERHESPDPTRDARFGEAEVIDRVELQRIVRPDRAFHVRPILPPRLRQHFLYLTPLPHGQGELRPKLGRPRFISRASAAARCIGS